MTRQRIAITGSSGLIGGALSAFLRERGDTVVRLVRRHPVPPYEVALPAPGEPVDELAAALNDVDVVVNLAGAGIGDHRWTASYKKALRDSRIDTTTTLVEALAHCSPKRLVSGSAMGFYGDRGEEVLDETSSAGSDFLADLVVDWEGCAERATSDGHSVAFARTTLVVSAQGGAFAQMALPAKFGVLGPLGSGRQWWSWISLRDEVRALTHLIDHPDITGPVNLAAPLACRQAGVAKALGRSMRRPAVAPAPEFALRAVLGEMSTQLTASTRVRPAVLQASGFTWMDSNLDQVLDRLAADLSDHSTH